MRILADLCVRADEPQPYCLDDDVRTVRREGEGRWREDRTGVLCGVWWSCCYHTMAYSGRSYLNINECTLSPHHHIKSHHISRLS